MSRTDEPQPNHINDRAGEVVEENGESHEVSCGCGRGQGLLKDVYVPSQQVNQVMQKRHPESG